MYAAIFPIILLRKAKSKLESLNLTLKDYKPVFLNEEVYFPIKEPNKVIYESGGRIDKVPSDFFPVRPRRVLSLSQLEKKYGIPFPKSVDIIGDIALLNYIPDPKFAKIVGEKIMSNFGVRAIFLKTSEMKDPYRIAKWKRIVGHGDTFTVHTENGCYYALDISKVFFNPRLGSERLRVINQVSKNEVVIDMFAGVGPFAIPIAKKGAKTHAIDINPYAINYAQINIKINDIPRENLFLYNRDAKEICKELYAVADRIIMNYPERSLEFIDVALNLLKPDGGIIHFYIFVRETSKKSAINSAIKKIIELLVDFNISIKVLNAMASREVAPRKFLVVLDLFLRPKFS